LVNIKINILRFTVSKISKKKAKILQR